MTGVQSDSRALNYQSSSHAQKAQGFISLIHHANLEDEKQRRVRVGKGEIWKRDDNASRVQTQHRAGYCGSSDECPVDMEHERVSRHHQWASP